jgi:DNA-binding CsgD family transcriptional regulator
MHQDPSHIEAALVERAAELHVLERAVAGLAGGTGGVVVLEAPAGLGKTALLDYSARLARDAGYLVRHAAPGPHERQFAFGVVRTLLEAPLRNLPASERAAILTGASAPAGALLLGGELPGAAEATAIAHGVMWACAGLARTRPVVLIVDDAQWSDRASLHVLSYLAGRAGDLPLLVLLAARPDDPRAANDLLALLGGGRSATVLHPQPLTPMGAARLIRELAPDVSIHICCECHRAADGNPWLLAELGRQLQLHGPAAVAEPGTVESRMTPSARAVVRRRMAELEPRDRAVAAARAVIGDGAPPHAIAQVAAVALAELGPAQDALAAAGLLRLDVEGTVHELIASAIRDDLAPAERERLHRESARALIELGATSELVAHHLLQCRPHGDAEVSDWLERAGEAAVERGAPATAVTYLERALEERADVTSRGRLLANLAAAAFDAGAPGPRTRLRGALDETPDRTDRLHLLTRLAAHDVVYGGDAGDVQLLTDELTDPRTGPEDQVRVQTAVLDALVALPERHVDRARRAAAIDLHDIGDPVLRRAVIAHRAWLATELGTADAQTCAAMALDALDGGFLLRAARHRAAYHLCIAVLMATDHAPQAHRAIVALRDEALARGSMPLRAAAATNAAELSLRTGRAGEAETQARDALELAGGNASLFAERASRVLVAALAERGAFDEARESLSACGNGELHAHAQLALAEGEFEQAHAHARDAGARDEQRGRPNPACAGWRSIASLALAHLGRRDQAVLLADGELGLAESFGAPVPIARAMVARAVAEPDDRTRISICRRALASLEASRACGELESVRLRLELGRTLARVGRRIEARELLRPALADADAVGASQLAARARRELVATGLRPRRAALEGASALTPRQRQIVELAAAGKGNRAIAEQLFLSIKTVETHLAAGYRKLGVSTRLDLSAAVAGRTR